MRSLSRSLVILAFGCVAYSQPLPVQPATVQGAVHSMTLPNFNPEMPEGPDRTLFLNSCTVCHSARYVLMQYPFSRSIWTAEVKKMRKAYGCPLEESKIELLVEYLMAIRGVKP